MFKWQCFPCWQVRYLVGEELDVFDEFLGLAFPGNDCQYRSVRVLECPC